MRHYLQFGRFGFNLQGTQALVMGILNITPDSFSDAGQYQHLEFAISRAEQMIVDGVDIIDIGGESSRPGAPPLPLQDELARVMPVLYALRDCGKPLSVDTYKPEVMREAILAGADMINDINGFRAPGAIEAVRDSDCALCIMHMQSVPQTMQDQPQYDDVVREVIAFLRERIDDDDGGRHRPRTPVHRSRFWFWQDGGTELCLAARHAPAAQRTGPARAGRPVAQVDDRRRHGHVPSSSAWPAALPARLLR